MERAIKVLIKHLPTLINCEVLTKTIQREFIGDVAHALGLFYIPARIPGEPFWVCDTPKGKLYGHPTIYWTKEQLAELDDANGCKRIWESR